MVTVYCCTGKVQHDRLQELCAVEMRVLSRWQADAQRVVVVRVYDAQRRVEQSCAMFLVRLDYEFDCCASSEL